MKMEYSKHIIYPIHTAEAYLQRQLEYFFWLYIGTHSKTFVYA